MEDALRLNACAVATQVFIGGEFETQSVTNLTKLIDQGLKVGMPVLGPARWMSMITTGNSVMTARPIASWMVEPLEVFRYQFHGWAALR